MRYVFLLGIFAAVISALLGNEVVAWTGIILALFAVAVQI
jgi:hypothetical protein